MDLAGSQGGGLVAVGAGTYLETLTLGDDHRNVTLAGRCREGVTIDGSEGAEDEAAVLVKGHRRTPEVEIEGVTVTGGAYTGAWVEHATVSVNAVDFRDNTVVGLVAMDAAVTLDCVGVYGTRPERGGDLGHGIEILEGATLTATGCVIAENADAGVVAIDPGTVVELVDTLILDTVPGMAGAGGWGIDMHGGSALSAIGCTIEGNAEVGLAALGSGTSVVLEETSIVGTAGYGVVVEGAALTARGSSIQGNVRIGVIAAGAGTVVQLEDTRVLDTLLDADGLGGYGIEIDDGAALTAIRSTIQGNLGAGIMAGEDTIVDLVDTAVVETGGFGIEVHLGGALTCQGCLIQANERLGVAAADAGTVVVLDDTRVLDTRPNAAGMFGTGVQIGGGAWLTFSDSTIQGNVGTGVLGADAGTVVELIDTAILDTDRNRDGGFGVGLSAQAGARIIANNLEASRSNGPGIYVASGATLTCSACTLSDNAFAAVLVTAGALDVTSSTLVDTRADDENGGGFGIYATSYFGPPSLSVTDSTIGAHPYAAVWLDGPGSYDLQGNALSGSDGVEVGDWLLHGNAVFAERGMTPWDGSNGLRLLGNTFSGASEVGVLLDGASATLGGNTWSDNGTDILQQRCPGQDGVAPLTNDDLDGVPDAVVCPERNVLTAYDLVFTSLYLPETEPLE